MDSNLYRELILDHWRNPKHFGKLDHATHQSYFENTLCGDAIGWHISVVRKRKTENGTIDKAMFYGEGCALSIAGASVVAEHIQGMPLKQAKLITQDWVARELRITPTPARERCVTLGLDALRKALSGVQ
ncbi:iron-sulfur cluster assembly scaffold protein [Candidatus Berkelbacteria bacterium]|nr:iron-sulfur cluster assembly scaffold protein [Candidatus Berkelbacteria bacterium]